MSTSIGYIALESYCVSTEIRRLIGTNIFMSLGAHDFTTRYGDDKSTKGGLAFQAIILPFRKDGTRGTRARKMRVEIDLTAADTYNVTVWYLNKFDVHDHYEAEGIYNDQLPKILLALDYDGDTILNPRVL